jgi:hypothetical protein
VVTGAPTAPTFVLTPRHRGRGAETGKHAPEPAIDTELQ